MAVQFALVDVGATGSAGLVFGRTIARRVPLERSSPDGLVRGYSSALAGDVQSSPATLRPRS
jgi:hypothetical protein